MSNYEDLMNLIDSCNEIEVLEKLLEGDSDIRLVATISKIEVTKDGLIKTLGSKTKEVFLEFIESELRSLLKDTLDDFKSKVDFYKVKPKIDALMKVMEED